MNWKTNLPQLKEGSARLLKKYNILYRKEGC